MQLTAEVEIETQFSDDTGPASVRVRAAGETG